MVFISLIAKIYLFNELFESKFSEILQINGNVPDKSMIVGIIFRPPSTDVDEFNEYLVDTLIASKGTLDNLKYIDKTAETLSLIVDNYIGKLVNDVLESHDIDGEIIRIKREKKLKTLI